MSERYDITVIGSGPGGYRAAILAALRGKQVAIVEKAEWGGCCLNRGCVPKKDWHHTATVLASGSGFSERGIRGTLEPDIAAAWAHQKRVVETVRDSYVNYMKRLGVTAYVGHGALLDTHTVEVRGAEGVQSLDTEHVILATGSSPHVPEGIALQTGRVLTTDMLFDEPVPAGARVALIGSGVIGTEFAFILSLLGKQVSWLTRSRPLSKSRFSPQARRTLSEALKKHGVEPRVGVQPTAVRAEEDGVVLDLNDGSTLEVDWVLLGTGRRPHTEGIGLEQVGIATDERGFIVRGPDLRTSVPNIYAIGDVTSPQMTANQALADATLAIENILSGGSAAQDPNTVPEAIYSAVEMARIGLEDDEAEDGGFEPAVGFAAFETSPRALGQGDSEGFVRLLADMDSGALLGGEIVGAEAAELIHLLSAADPQTALRQLTRARYNHPGRAEELQNAVETMASKWGLDAFVYGK